MRTSSFVASPRWLNDLMSDGTTARREADSLPTVDVALLRRLIDRLPAMIAYWTPDGFNVFANAAYEAVHGRTPEEMSGWHQREIFGERLFELNAPFFEAAVGGEEQRFERTIVDMAGQEHHTEVNYVPDVIDGVTVGISVLVVDQTPRVNAVGALRRSDDLQRVLIRSMSNTLVLLFDVELRFVHASGPLLGLFGMRPEDIEGRTLYETLPYVADEIEDHYRAALRGELSQWERELKRRVVAFTASPVLNDRGEVFAGLTVGVDVTEDRRRAATLFALRRIASASATGENQAEVFDLIVTNVRELFNADSAGIGHFVNDHVEVLAAVPNSGKVGELLKGGSGDVTALQRVAETGVAQLVHYTLESKGRSRALYESGIRFGAAAPVHVDGRLWGAIAIGLEVEDEPNDELLINLSEFAEAAAASVSNSEAWRLLSEQATRDGLTGLSNRRAFDEQLAVEVQVARRTGRPLSLVIFDIDNFKDINDALGHPVGDQVIAVAAERMAAIRRSGEMLARIGGEEFGLLLPGAGPAEAVATAERYRASISSMEIVELKVRASAGVCADVGQSMNAETLYSKADRALYEAKRSGRNRTHLHVEDTTTD